MALMLLVLVPLVPALLAPLVMLPGGRRLLPVAPWLPLSALLLLPIHGEFVELPWLLLGTRLGVDVIAFPLVLLATVAWTLAGWHARNTMGGKDQPRFFCFWLFAWCGNISVFLTLDAASFYAAYAMLTVAAYGLIVHRRRPEDYRAGRVYMWMSVIAEGLLLSGLLMLVAAAGNLPLGPGPVLVASADHAQAIAMLMLLGFGTKMGLAGLHMWLPLAHPQAPVPASAVLSGVILKAGLVGWLRFLPLGQPGFETLGTALLVAGVAGALGGVAIGITQRGLKSLLAYSSVSQMGLMSIIVALALVDHERGVLYIALAVLHALHHGLNKSLLFLGVDLLRAAPRLARRLVWLPSASLAGLPLTSGALAKASLKEALPAVPASLSGWLLAISAATTVLMIRFLVIAREQEPGARGCPTAPWHLLLLASISLPWLYAWRVSPLAAAAAFDAEHLRDALLPIAAGAILAVLVEWLVRRGRLPAVPAGDVLHLLPRMPRRPVLQWPKWRYPDWATPLGRVESRLSRLAAAVITGVILALLLVLA